MDAFSKFLEEIPCYSESKSSTENPWVHTTIFIGAFALAILVVNFFVEGPFATLCLIPGFLFCVVWQQSDLYWHLGLNRQIRTGTLLSVISAATSLTLLRGLGAFYLLGRFIGRMNTPSWLLLLVFLLGIITDILDGQIADGEADFFYTLQLHVS